MDYTATLERIHSLNKFGSRPGLERVKMLLELMGNPQDSLEFVHVVGTNGKGSVSAMVSSVLRCAGYKTGLFISPYITDFCERMQISNNYISRDYLCDIAQYVFGFVDELNARDIIITEFEFVMCVAFEYFKREACDVVVLEAGLGGLLDCTNVIKSPLCCVITPIGLDHTDILGDTVEKIAQQKCGVIKSGTRCVSAQQTSGAQAVIRETCEKLSVPLSLAHRDNLKSVQSTLEGSSFEYKGKTFMISLVGEHQVDNAATAIEVLEALVAEGFDKIDEDSLRRGLKSAQNPARFEVLGNRPTVILDGAHNPDGMQSLASSVGKYLSDRRGVLIIGMLSDKDSKSSLEYIDGMFEKVYTVPIDNPRALTSSQMAEIARRHFAEVKACDSIKEAFDSAYEDVVHGGGFLCVCGSLYLAGELRSYAIKTIREGNIIRLFDN